MTHPKQISISGVGIIILATLAPSVGLPLMVWLFPQADSGIMGPVWALSVLTCACACMLWVDTNIDRIDAKVNTALAWLRRTYIIKFD